MFVAAKTSETEKNFTTEQDIMCRKFRLIQNIENVSIEELCAYLRRLLRIYMILIVVNVINLITSILYKRIVGEIFAAISIALYLLNIFWINAIRANPTVANTNRTIGGLTLLSAFNIADLIFNVVTGSLWGLASLIGVVLQWSTIYIIYKLREKILFRDMNPGSEYSQSATNPTAPPIAIAYAEPVANPVASSPYGKSSDKV